MRPFLSIITAVIHHGRRRWLLATWLILAAFRLWGGTAVSNAEVFDEYQVKANFLRNFAQFIEWPSEAFRETNSPICIGVLGEDAGGLALRLDRAVKDESVKGRKFEIKKSQRLEDLKTCHILFICQSEKGKAVQILTELEKTSAVTVSEMPGFAHRGGIFNFFLQGTKVRFEINFDVATRRNLRISSQLSWAFIPSGPAKEKK